MNLIHKKKNVPRETHLQINGLWRTVQNSLWQRQKTIRKRPVEDSRDVGIDLYLTQTESAKPVSFNHLVMRNQATWLQSGDILV